MTYICRVKIKHMKTWEEETQEWVDRQSKKYQDWLERNKDKI